MLRRLALLLASLLLLGFVVTGCGDDDDDGDSSGGATTSQQPAEDTSGSDSDSDDAASPDGASVEQAVKQCESSIDSQPQLSDDIKSDLQDLCEKAANGDEEAVRDASRDVCVKIIEETAPEGPVRDQALEACERAAP